MAIIVHERTDLPTVAEIEISPDVLSVQTKAVKVAPVRERFADKIDYSIPPLGTQNMILVAHNRVPVLKVHDNFVYPETQCYLGG